MNNSDYIFYAANLAIVLLYILYRAKSIFRKRAYVRQKVNYHV